MATYGLKYRAEFKNIRKQEYRLDIYQRGYTGASKEIKTLCGCVLEIQGAQGNVTDPIVKTQLRFSVVDAWDIADTESGKWGNWGEFYTPDATLYKVQLSGSDGEMWTGYITPDSWQEDLGYRTAITVTARDNIGHLKDFPFSMTPNSDGLIKISDLIEEAMETIELAMTYTVARSGLGPTSLQNVTADGVYLHDAYINAELLDGMDWYAALEQTLEATGMSLRYVGNNKIEITYLRNVPKMGSPYASPGYQTLEFYGGSLEFEPAVKQIVEDVDFKMRKEVPLEILSGIQYGSSNTYRCKVDGNTLPAGGTVSIPEHDAPYDPVSSPGSSVWANGSYMLDPSGRTPYDFLKRDEGEDGWKQYAMIAANHVADAAPYVSRSSFRFHTRTAAVKVTVNFTPHPLTIGNSGASTGKMKAPHYSLSEIKYQARYVSDDQTVIRYWDGAGWTNNSSCVVKREYDAQNEYGTALEIELAECDDIESGLIVISFYNIKYKMWYDGGTGVYARVQSILVGLTSTRAVDNDRVTTINNQAYNVKIERKPLFGALSSEVGFVQPSNYLAALFYYPSGESSPEQYPYMVHFNGQSASRAVPLPVIIHQQILCFRHGAARVLNGNCAPINKAAFDLTCQFRYKGTTYILQGGTLDLFSGIMNGAVFHEFVLFDDLWTGTPSYSGDTSYNTDTPGTGYSGGNSGGSPGGGGGGGGTVESVGMTVPSEMSVSPSQITSSGTFEVTWANQTKNKVLASPTSASGVPVFRDLDASDIPSLPASKITSGTLDTARIPNLNASKITAGTLDAARIPNLDASKITSGTFAAARIPDQSGKYVTLDTDQNNISGEKTFTTKPMHIGRTSGIDVDGYSYIDIGEVRLVYDSTNKALHITTKSGNETIGLYADGFVSARGAAASGDQIKFVTLTGTQSVDGVKIFLANIIANGTITINGVTLTGSSSKLSLNKNASFAGIVDTGYSSGHVVSIQDIVDRLVRLENA